MKRYKVFYFLISFLLLFTDVSSKNTQTKTQWKNLLDAYCEENYQDCFGQTYIKVAKIEKINKITERKVNIRGEVGYTNFFGSFYKREFKATIVVFRDKVEVNFQRKGYSSLRGEFWKECNGFINPR